MPLASRQTPSRWAFALLPVLLAPEAHAAAIERYDGVAHAVPGGALVYRETHWLFSDRGTPARLVLYRCPDGLPFARKQLRGDGAAPDVRFEDARDGYRESVSGMGPRREVYWQPRPDLPAKRRSLPVAAGDVVDAGFDAFVRSHWNALVSGRAASTAFLLPSAQDFLDVRIAKVLPDVPGRLHLRMRLDAWYGFAAPETDLVYRLSDRWLLQFTGIGSIRDRRGRHQTVRLEFPDPPRAMADPAERDAALHVPLIGRCAG